MAEVGAKVQVKMLDQMWPAEIVEDSPYDSKNAAIRVDG
jgi:dimethylglycine dehydrogenase